MSGRPKSLTDRGQSPVSAPFGALDLAERALSFVRAGDGALATVVSERSILLRFARSHPTQSTAIDDATISITVLRDGRVGTAATNRDDDESLTNCARAAEAAAESAARTRGSGSYPGFPGPAPIKPHDGFDAATAELDPAAGGRALATAFEVAQQHGVEAHGVWSLGDVETGIAATTGIAAVDRVTDAFMKTTCIAPDGRSGWANRTGVAVTDLDPHATAEAAAIRATGAIAQRRDVVKLEPGEYPVVLAPAAIAEMLGWLALSAFNGLAHAEGRGALVGRLGACVVAPSINLSDSPRYPRALARAFDAEGVPKAPLPLIQDGVAMDVAHDTRSAALVDGASSTGHALSPGGSSWGAMPWNMVLAGGGAADETELCAPIERGVYVTRVWYTNPIRPNETLITGVSRDGTFLIEDGQIAAPLADLRLTDRVLGVLEKTEALTRDQILWSEGEFYGRRFATGTVAPAIRSRLRFSGGA
jgi:PmbA protein